MSASISMGGNRGASMGTGKGMSIGRRLRLVPMATLALAGVVAAGLLPGCSSKQARPEAVVVGEHGGIAELSTDLARYEPGRPVRLRARLSPGTPGDELVVRYTHLARTVAEETVKLQDGAADWSWQPPKDDGQGYLVEAFVRKGGAFTDFASVGVDVSSDWGRFPRYGYLADFGEMPEESQRQVIDRLNRLHIGGIQFYDWQSKHHRPLATEDDGEMAASWTDIANRPISAQTVRRYIDDAHARGMKAMNYNLLFGANRDYEADGAKKEWGLFKDTSHEQQDSHPLPASWKSDIYLMNPANAGWQDYLIAQEKKVFDALPFDGYHVDQLGERGALWDYDGDMVDLPSGYLGFLQAAKSKLDVDYVMNAVNGYGQEQIAKAPVKFLYTEVWMDQFADLKAMIDRNLQLGGGKKNSVLAAYMDYDLADGAGQFNPPGVLLTDAVIFAAGGAHLEAGEGLLAKEYFPNRNLAVPDSLWKGLQGYYDFLVAYENLLRDGQEDADVPLAAPGGPALSTSAETGKIWTIGKRKGNTDIVHLINLVGADSTSWKDAAGTMPEPTRLEKFKIHLPLTDGRKVSRIWIATPDRLGGSPSELSYDVEGDGVSFTVPSLLYWDMAVIEYKE